MNDHIEFGGKEKFKDRSQGIYAETTEYESVMVSTCHYNVEFSMLIRSITP